jgi:hypothetical protein
VSYSQYRYSYGEPQGAFLDGFHDRYGRNYEEMSLWISKYLLFANFLIQSLCIIVVFVWYSAYPVPVAEIRSHLLDNVSVLGAASNLADLPRKSGLPLLAASLLF